MCRSVSVSDIFLSACSKINLKTSHCLHLFVTCRILTQVVIVSRYLHPKQNKYQTEENRAHIGLLKLNPNISIILHSISLNPTCQIKVLFVLVLLYLMNYSKKELCKSFPREETSGCCYCLKTHHNKECDYKIQLCRVQSPTTSHYLFRLP